MAVYPEKVDDMKRKLRSLKKLEVRIRFGETNALNTDCFSSKGGKKFNLVWDEFFHMGVGLCGKAKYSLYDIAAFSKEQYKEIVEEFFFSVYYRYYMENGITGVQLYDPDILKWMGLLPGAGIDDIKKKFRELAKKYHPDTGGDKDRFIELMDNYNRLVE